MMWHRLRKRVGTAALMAAAAGSGFGCGSDKASPPAGTVKSASPNGGAAKSAGSAANPAPNATGTATSANKPTAAPSSSDAKAPGPKTPKPPKKKSRYQKLEQEDIDKLVKPQLVDETIAHPPFRGPYGPSLNTVVVLTKKKSEDIGGFVLVERDGKVKKTALPILQESWPGVSVEAMGFVAECDGDKVEELVVISKHRSASGVATVASIIDFDGGSFRKLENVETLAANAKTVGDVRAVLKARTFIMRVDGVPVRVLPTLTPPVVTTRLEKLMGVKANATDTEVTFDYTEKQGREPAQFTFSFNDTKVLQKIVVGAAGEESDSKARNPTAAKLASWLDKAANAKKDGTKTTWTYKQWLFELDESKTADGDNYTMTITPQR